MLTMSTKYKFRNQEIPHFVSFAVVDWIDVFVRNTYRDILVDSIAYCQREKGLIVYSWCIMTSHVHMIIGTKANPMQDILRDMKSYTSGQLKLAITENPQESRKEWMLELMQRAGEENRNNRGFQFWQQDNHPIELSTNEMIDQRLDYIHNNPVEAGFVIHPEDYPYSSARDYSGEKGYLDVVLIE